MSVKRETKEQERIAGLKKKFLEYFKDLPIQHLAANYIGRDQDTICAWKNQDPEFSDAVANLKAEWALKNVKSVRDKKWLLERVLRNHFSPRTELTGSEGKDLPTPLLTGVIDVRKDDSTTKAS